MVSAVGETTTFHAPPRPSGVSPALSAPPPHVARAVLSSIAITARLAARRVAARPFSFRIIDGGWEVAQNCAGPSSRVKGARTDWVGRRDRARHVRVVQRLEATHLDDDELAVRP